MLPDHEVSFCHLPSPSIFNLQLPFPQDIKICIFFSFLSFRRIGREKGPYSSPLSLSFPVLLSLLRGPVGGNYVIEGHSQSCEELVLPNVNR